MEPSDIEPDQATTLFMVRVVTFGLGGSQDAGNHLIGVSRSGHEIQPDEPIVMK